MRVFLVVIDSFGIGAMPDAELYGDVGSDTYGNVFARNGVRLQNLASLGLNNIEGVSRICSDGKILNSIADPTAVYARLSEKTPAKDTTAGHYEISGLVLQKPFKTYKKFPKELVEEIERRSGVSFIGNEVASGTEIIQRLGQEHLQTGNPILYTSQDSVLQIAADVSVVPLAKLYQICEIARSLTVGEYAVGRVIARPFKHEGNKFVRTEDRKDFALEPPGVTMLDRLTEKGVPVTGIGKISDIFCGRGLTHSIHTGNNHEGLAALLRLVREKNNGLFFANLVDTDMLYGHRNNVQGYANALAEIDASIPSVLSGLNEDDILILTADHGCDPTTESTDHSREYVPLLIYGRRIVSKNLGTLNGFDCIADFILSVFGLKTDSVIYDNICFKGV